MIPPVAESHVHTPISKPNPPAPSSSEAVASSSWFTEASSSSQSRKPIVAANPSSNLFFRRVTPDSTPQKHFPIFPPGCKIPTELPPIHRTEKEENYFKPSRCKVDDARFEVPINFNLGNDWTLERWMKYLGLEYTPPEPNATPEPRWRDSSQDVPPPGKASGTAAFEARMKIVVEEFFAPLRGEYQLSPNTGRIMVTVQ
ncbi:hypothetical protein PCANC_05766 [Puccinia coronata f. sp. avenae]|uniref:Uncharacterized protein n=1 Tax=Puccinia coronata f. sp. avenae TaxID=200324 RepID=A0A2N5S0A6_9BASI|nr:hypothetical protein PCANC_25182 [Puccinia coronata f. sp. avenae]PLW52919.1 hypothetical protein PCANC_05766 [Puccinia coronata f. sp. avenae]